jgi:cation:H+ antiporter
MVLAELSILVISIFVLSRAATLVVDSAAKLARFFKVSTLAIGLLLVSVSTSLPELSVSVMSSVAGEGAIAAGNVFGSNIANMLLILGLGAALYGFKVRKEILPDIAIVLLATTIISVYIMYKSSVEGSALSFHEGVLLLLVFVWYANRILSKKRIESPPVASSMSLHDGLHAFLLFGAGVVVVIISSSFVVDSAVSLAKIAGLAESFIGATIIAIGTSLPELSVDLAAIRKKQYGLALGDAIGSNMANLTLVLGTAAAISPIVVQLKIFAAALLFAIIANMAFLYIAVVKKEFCRKEGIAMLALYAIYIIVIFYLQFA